MVKRSGKFVLIVITICMAVSSISFINRYKFGTWSPFKDPNRLEFRERRYYPSKTQPISQENDLMMVKSSLYWGRGLFVDKESYQAIDINKKYETYIIVYLKQNDGKFKQYTLSGGP